MVVVARIIFAAFIVFLLFAAILIFSSIAGFWGGGYMIVSAVMVIVTWGVLTALMVRTLILAFPLAVDNGGDSDKTLYWSSRLFLTIAIHSVVTGLGLGFLAFVGCGCFWLPNLYHWVGLVCAFLGFTMYFLLPWIVRTFAFDDGIHSKPYSLWVKIVFPVLVAVIWGLAWLIPYLYLKGDINEADYKRTGPPPRPDQVYKLPFPGGESSWVIQGNNSGSNHSGSQKYAWDFRRPCGTPILAARGGFIASDPIVNNDGVGGSNNEIDVDQGDGTIGRYLHFQYQSTKLKKNDRVNPGDELAKVGSVGNSLTGHIHFVVDDKVKKTSVAITFQDVKEDGGIPRTFHSYKSGNRFSK